MNSPIVLLTDFGLRDPYAGIVKGVILSKAPKAAIVDLCHELPPRDARAAAFMLRVSVPYFPKGSLFVCVVDPGVGSSRRILWARTKKHQFLAPDNGLLSWLEDPVLELRSVQNEALFLPRVSATFHGRDVFAPVAGRLAAGLSPSRLGPAAREMVQCPWPAPERRGESARGEVLWVDRFGNAVTNLTSKEVAPTARIVFKGRSLGRVRGHYAQAGKGEALALFGSSGHVELSIRDGDFAARFKARLGDPVESGK